MKRIRGGSGLGDAIYLRPIADHFLGSGNSVVVCSNYPALFADMPIDVQPFRRDNIDVVAHYTMGKANGTTNQWQDICALARVPTDLPLRTRWEQRNTALVERLRQMAGARPMVLLHGGRTPMGRTDGFGAELLPRSDAFTAVLDAFKDCFLVKIGSAEQIYPLQADIDLNGSTSLTDLLDVALDCDAVIAQCSFAVPLAEIFAKPLLAIWSALGMESARHPYIRQITPQKVLSKPSSRYVLDSWEPDRIQAVATEFARGIHAS